MSVLSKLRNSGFGLKGMGVKLIRTFSIVMIVSAIILAVKDFRLSSMSRTGPEPLQPNSSGIVVYRAAMESFDVDSGTVVSDMHVLFSTVQQKESFNPISSYPSSFYCQTGNGFALDLANPIIYVSGPGNSQFTDLGRLYSSDGLRAIQDVQPLGPCDPKQAGAGFTQVTELNHPHLGRFIELGYGRSQLYAVGDSREFPFDKYLVIYRIWVPVLLQLPDGRYIGVLGIHEIDNHVPGFLLRYATAKEIETWSKPTLADSLTAPIAYDDSMWSGRQNAVVLERPLFLKVISIVLAVVLALYLVWFAIREETDKLTPDILGFFLTVWAIRAALSVGAPKIPTLIDYGALCFYIAFLAVVSWKFTRSRPGNGSEERQSASQIAPHPVKQKNRH
jgi:hypothetical protein